MKNLLFAVTALVALSALAPNSSIAEPTHPNEVGLYTTPDGYGATGIYDVDVPVDVYLVLTRPTNVSGGMEPIGTITDFEIQLRFNPIGGMILTGEDFMGDGVNEGYNIGEGDHLGEGFLDYLVILLYEPVPVINEAVVLVALQFINSNDVPVEVTLYPCINEQVWNQISFVTQELDDPDDWYQAMHPISGSRETPVFIFGGEAVAVENETFGSVKALYR